MRKFIKKVQEELKSVVEDTSEKTKVVFFLAKYSHPEMFPEVEEKWDIVIDPIGKLEESEVIALQDKLINSLNELGIPRLSVVDYGGSSKNSDLFYIAVASYSYNAENADDFNQETAWLKEKGIDFVEEDEFKEFTSCPEWGPSGLIVVDK